MRRTWLFAAMAMSVACMLARADDAGTLLRYKWVEGQQMTVDVSVHTAGTVTVSTAKRQQTVNTDVQAGMSIFSKVDKITPEGWAKLRISFGLISFDTTGPKGTVVHGEMNPADNTLVITANGQKQTRQMPVGSLDLLAKGFTPTLDDRGQVKSFPEAEKMQKALAAATGGNGAGSFGNMVSGLDPILPEKPVKVGDTWDIKVPVGQWLGQPGSQPVTMHFKYAGDEVIDGVPCRHLTATASLKNLHLVLPAASAPGSKLQTSMEHFSMDSSMDYYMSKADTHLVQAKMDALEGGSIHVQGTTKGPNGEDVDVDQSLTLQNYKVTVDMKRM